MTGAVGSAGLRRDAGQPARPLGQITRHCARGFRPACGSGKLGIEDGPLKLAQPVVAAHDVMFVPGPAGDAAAVVDRPAALGQLVVVREDNPTLARRLGSRSMEREEPRCRSRPHGVLYMPPRGWAGRAFNERQPVAAGQSP